MPTIKAPTIGLMGEPGTGKTTSLVTFLEAGIEVFDLITDPSGLDSMLDAINYFPLRNSRGEKVPRPNAQELLQRFHYHVVPAPTAGFTALKDTVHKIGTMSFKDLKFISGGKDPSTMEALLNNCVAFHDDRTGVIYEDATEWGDNRVLALDGLSGLNEIVRKLVVGHKPSPDQGEWGIMVGAEHDFLYQLMAELRCYFVLLCHLTRSSDEISGAVQTVPKGITYNFSGSLGKDLSEVIRARRVKDVFTWSTSESDAAVKNRILPISDQLPPTFLPIIEGHRARVALMNSSAPPPAQPGTVSPPTV